MTFQFFTFKWLDIVHNYLYMFFTWQLRGRRKKERRKAVNKTLLIIIIILLYIIIRHMTTKQSKDTNCLKIPTYFYTLLHIPTHCYTLLHIPPHSCSFLHIAPHSYTLSHTLFCALCAPLLNIYSFLCLDLEKADQVQCPWQFLPP